MHRPSARIVVSISIHIPYALFSQGAAHMRANGIGGEEEMQYEPTAVSAVCPVATRLLDSLAREFASKQGWQQTLASKSHATRWSTATAVGFESRRTWRGEPYGLARESRSTLLFSG
jgi:hypothetical protein